MKHGIQTLVAKHLGCSSSYINSLLLGRLNASRGWAEKFKKEIGGRSVVWQAPLNAEEREIFLDARKSAVEAWAKKEISEE